MPNEKVVYCALTEQGDLGLGANELDEKDQKVMSEYNKKQKQNSDKENDK